MIVPSDRSPRDLLKAEERAFVERICDTTNRLPFPVGQLVNIIDRLAPKPGGAKDVVHIHLCRFCRGSGRAEDVRVPATAAPCGMSDEVLDGMLEDGWTPLQVRELISEHRALRRWYELDRECTHPEDAQP